MRYILIDRIVTLERRRSLTGYKLISASDGLVTEYAPGLSALPAAMVLEGMAQAAGLLLTATLPGPGFPVLAKVRPFISYGCARPGDRVDVRAELEEMNDDGCRTRVTAAIDGRPLAEAQVFLARLAIGPEAEAQGALLRAGLAETYPDWFESAPEAASR